MKYEIKKIVGIDCIIADLKDSNSVTFEILVKAWSLYENKKNNWISHFLEHMFFKWWKKYPDPHSVAQAVENFGGEFNAFTGDDHAGYYVKCAPNFLDKAMDVLADMIIDSRFPIEELEREKWVVLQEIKMYEDDPQSLVYDKWKEWFYWDNSYGRTTLWTEENVSSFTQEQLFEHKNWLYTKSNLIIIVAWKINDIKKVEDRISELFEWLPNDHNQERPPYLRDLPKQSVNFFDNKTQQNHLIIAAPWFSGQDETRFAAKILSTMLWWNMSSRLFQNIREKQGLCYYIGASHIASDYDGLFYIRAWIDKERFDFGVEKINEEIDRFATGNFTQEEFDNAIGYRIGSLQMWIESSDSLANFLWNQHLIYGRILTIDDIIKKYQEMTIDEVKKIASKLKSSMRYMYYIK